MKSDGRNEDGSKTNLQEKRIPLKAVKGLTNGVERQVKHVQADCHRQWYETDEEKERQHNPGPHHSVEEHIARIQPGECRQQCVRPRAELGMHILKVIVRR